MIEQRYHVYSRAYVEHESGMLSVISECSAYPMAIGEAYALRELYLNSDRIGLLTGPTTEPLSVHYEYWIAPA